MFGYGDYQWKYFETKSIKAMHFQTASYFENQPTIPKDNVEKSTTAHWSQGLQDGGN